MKQDDFLEHVKSTKKFLSEELTKIRTGRASAGLVDDIMVNAYDGASPLPLKEVASVSIPESQLILISPWDRSVTAKIEKAIIDSGKGFTPINDGENIRIPIPAVTEERRMALSKEISGLVEQAKVKLRTLRQNVIKAIEEQEDNGIITEDDMYKMKKEIDAEIATANKELEEMGKEKENEVLKI